MRTYARARMVARELGASRPVEVDGREIVDGYRGVVVETEFEDLEDRLSVFDNIDWVDYTTLAYPPWLRVYGRVSDSPVMVELNVNWGCSVRASEDVVDEVEDLGSVTVIRVPELRVSDATAWPAVTRFVLSHMIGVPGADQAKWLAVDNRTWVLRVELGGVGEILVGLGEDTFPVELSASEELEKKVSELADVVDEERPVTMTYPGDVLYGVAGPGFKVGIVGGDKAVIITAGKDASELANRVKEALGVKLTRVAEVR